MIPAFSLEAAPGAAWRMGVSALVLLAAVVASTWAASGGVAPWLAATALLATLPSVSLLRLPTGGLQWDGVRFRCDGVDGSVALCLDLGSWMLLRWRPASGARPWRLRWLPVSARTTGPAGWHALRCALHAPVVARDG